MIEIHGLTKRYGDKTAVDGLTLSVPRGAMFGFLGPNGAGKTTTLRILMGLLQPSMGNARIEGFDVTQDAVAVRACVGYLPDEVFLYDYLTGQQFLEFVADMRGIRSNERDARIRELLDFFGLASAAGEYTVNYSFGMKKKLALAGIVMHKPSVLLLDEPFNGLDPQAVKDCRSMLSRMTAEGSTVLFSSHVLEVVEKLVTHVAIIDNGKLRAAGTLAEVCTSHENSLEKAFFALTAQSAPV
ncbi:MAG TPA: ABC transporter ATP-binding protein [Candidatus Ozemobacteraceae bacterium]|nr:ABC transporter ATP-binding protein [Candidatus Ozemobacteraceae bacterium]